MPLGHKEVNKNMTSGETWKTKIPDFVIIIVPTDDLATCVLLHQQA